MNIWCKAFELYSDKIKKGITAVEENVLEKKYQYWQNQLLELGKKNKMISYRETKRATLKVLEPGFEELFTRVAINEEELTFQKPISKDSDIRIFSILELLNTLSAPIEVNIGDIKADGTVADATKTLKSLRSKSKLALDEQGTNILYLVFGFVEWREKGSKEDNWLKSPLVLVPVSIILESLNAPYVLKKYEDDIVVNPTLAYLYAKDFGIELPSFDPDEESIEDFMKKMESLVDKRGWKILRECSIGLVSFLKINMYNDLLNHEDALKSNPIIRAFSGERNEVNSLAGELYDFDHDAEKAIDTFMVVDADSSQQDAIMLAKNGVSFVMQGPPGTGKSQTITNIIAQGLADGKKILFVSEKMAALEVVYKRMMEVYLADFCLPLHSHKADKKKVLEELGKNLDFKRIKVKDEEISKLTELDIVRELLKSYVKDIHQEIMPLEMSPYEVYGEIVSMADLPDIPLVLDNIENISKDQINRLCFLVADFDNAKAALGPKWYKNPWQGIVIDYLEVGQKRELQDNLELIVRGVEKAQQILLKSKTLADVVTLNNVEKYVELLDCATICNMVPADWFIRKLDVEEKIVDIQKRDKEVIDILKKELSCRYEKAYFAIDGKDILSQINMLVPSIRRKENITADVLYENRQEYYDYYQEIIRNLNLLSDTYHIIADEYKLTGSDTWETIENYLELCQILLEHRNYTKHYFEIEGLARIKQLAEELPALFGVLQNNKKNILEKYVTEILDNDTLENDLMILNTARKCIDGSELQQIPGKEKMQSMISTGTAIMDGIYASLQAESIQHFCATYEVEAPSTEFNLKSYINAINKVFENRMYLQQWQDESYRVQAKQLLKNATEKYSELLKAKEGLQKFYTKSNINLEVKNISDETISLLEKMQYSFEAVSNLVANYNNESAYELLQEIVDNRLILTESKSFIDSVRNEYGVADTLAYDELLQFLETESANMKLCNPLQIWIDNIDGVKDILNNQIAKAKELARLHQKILEKCEVTVFDLEYGPILDRFKSEYTNIFKIFKSSYKEDIKKIRVVYKEVRKKIPDDEIITLLQTLKAYHEALQNYMIAKSETERLLNVSQFDIWYKWEDILRRVEIFERLTANFGTLSSVYAFLNNNILEELKKQLYTYQRITQWFNENNGENYFGSLYKNIDTDVFLIREELNRIKELSTYFEEDKHLEMFLLDNDIRASIHDVIILVSNVIETRKWFDEQAEKINSYLGVIYHEQNMKWQEIEQNLQNYECIVNVFGEKSAYKILNEKNQSLYEDVCKEFGNILEIEKAYMMVCNKDVFPEEYDEISIDEIISIIQVIISSLKDVNTVYEKLQVYRTDEIDTEYLDDITREMELVIEYQKAVHKYEESNDTYIELLGTDYLGEKTFWDVINTNIQKTERILKIVNDNVSEELSLALLTGAKLYSDAQLEELGDVFVKTRELEKKSLVIVQGLTIGDKIDIANQILEELNEYMKLCSMLLLQAYSTYSYEELHGDLKQLAKLQGLEKSYKENIARSRDKLHVFKLEYNTDWDEIINVFQNIKNVNRLIFTNNIDTEVADVVTHKNKNVSIAEMKYALEKVIHYKELVMGLICMFENQEKLCDSTLHRLHDKFERCLKEFSTMDAWIDFRDCREKCRQNGLGDFATTAEDIIYPNGQLNRVLLKSIYYAWFAKVCSGVDSIAKFKVREQNSRVQKFRELDKHQLPVAQMRIRERLINGMPNRSNYNNATDEMSVLMHELGKKRKIMPLRKLFRTIPNLLLKLKPCLMMSPLSVSYFLEADTYKFDMVIFDEASQIFPQDAIGAIFRGKQVIIAGDSKQLPPTNFFAANTSNQEFDYDNDEDVEEIISDSILEEATSSLPNRSLLWHYRSRNEDLISFSNQEIYQNNLITFPSSINKSADSGVEYVYVEDGIYESRCNKKEAEKCVALIEEHIKKHPNRSLGIIAFSESQQSAIEDALHMFRIRHTQYESFFDEKKEEPFFIKNLENVQGDERDTIIFSICYGKNAQGRMYMRFGPLGHQGGERRLNVAITRAKHNVKLVGSILPDDIDLNKTKSEGVKMLHSYIQFAISGNETLNKPKKEKRLYEVDTFSQCVGEFLEKRGLKVKMNVGNSDYTVDIAVEHPKREGCYFAGIECDGDSYQMARTVRDREHLRTAVLEQMGWKMYRVWSTEWIRNPENEQARLLDFLGEALKTYTMSEERKTVNITPSSKAHEVVDVIKSEPTLKKVNADNPYELPLYQQGDWRKVTNFRRGDNLSRLADMIHEVVRVEQPLHLELLYRRLASAFGNEKATAPIRRSVNNAITARMNGEVKIHKEFITLASFENVLARRSLIGVPDRNIEHISMLEIAEVMKKVLQGTFGMERNALIVETARVFGFERTGVNIKRAMNEAIDYLVDQQVIRICDDKIQLVEE